MSFLEVKNIFKKYNSVPILEDISFSVEKGNILALLGESGCGKTTLLRVLCGLEEADKGEMILEGTILFNNTSFVQPEKRKIGMVFQDYALFPHLNAMDNVCFGIGGLAKGERKEKAEEYLKKVGLANHVAKYPHELSGGQQQRLALARALAADPMVLLLDEPFSNLDDSLKQEMRLVVKEIISLFQITSILVTHDVDDAFALADRVGVINKGSLQQLDTPQIIYNKPVNEYTAKITGKINNIKGELVRPENISVSNTSDVKGVVEKIIFQGAYNEVNIKLKDSTPIIFNTKDTTLKMGDTIGVSWVRPS